MNTDSATCRDVCQFTNPSRPCFLIVRDLFHDPANWIDRFVDPLFPIANRPHGHAKKVSEHGWPQAVAKAAAKPASQPRNGTARPVPCQGRYRVVRQQCCGRNGPLRDGNESDFQSSDGNPKQHGAEKKGAKSQKTGKRRSNRDLAPLAAANDDDDQLPRQE